MSSNRHGLKRNVRVPKRYENSELNTGKRAVKVNNGSNNGIGKGAESREADPVVLSQESVETGDLVESEEVRDEELNCNGANMNVDVSVNPSANTTVDYSNVGIPNNAHNNDDRDKEESANIDNRKPYVTVVKRNEVNVDNHLIYVAPKIYEDGIESVLFDEDIVQKGCIKWQSTLCGYFVGQNMGFNELRYHVRRMWGKFGFKDVIVNESGINLFKFRDIEGMQQVLAKGPWMVNNRPLFVLKWNPEIGLKKVEPAKLPVWVKLLNVPMEAWSMEGISALASGLGRPLMMDEMTARMCENGIGRSDYARVLVEFEACKVMKTEIKIVYTDKDKKVKGTKMVNVMYDWKPDCCSHCKVFGHNLVNCCVRPRTVEELKQKSDEEERLKEGNATKAAKDSRISQGKNENWQQQRRNGQGRRNNYRQEYREKNVGADTREKDPPKEKHSIDRAQATTSGNKTGEPAKSSNKFEALNRVMEEDDNELRILKGRMVVDEFLNKKVQPNCGESSTWTQDMIRYFKDQWEIDRIKEKEEAKMNQEDVLESRNALAQTMAADNVIGLSKSALN